MPTWSGLSFQEGTSFDIEQISFFHDYRITIVVFVCLVTAYFISTCVKFKRFDSYLIERQELELFWTFLPSVILIRLAIPSIKVLYYIEETFDPVLSLKTTGHQWFWSYENINFKEETEIYINNSHLIRLLKTDKILALPSLTPIRNIISSTDVIHSWAVPRLGIKVDATPGRLNQSFFYRNLNSLVTGQCSEICGANHSFIPIIISFS